VIHWLVLTGGASSRFGRDKAATELDGRSLTDWSLRALLSIDESAPVSIVGSEHPGGPAAAVVSMLPEIDEEFVGVLAVDMPFAQHALAIVIESVQRESNNHGVANHGVAAWVPVDSTGRQQWLCAVYRRQALLDVARTRADWGGVAFHRLVGDMDTSVVPVPRSVSLLDIDTPEDFARAVGLAKEIER
jgi:molybdopterin-guanine dinucleotide biosynthesis protein A